LRQDMKKSFEKLKTGKPSALGLMGYVLCVFSFIYLAIIKFREWLYRLKILRKNRVEGVTVISIGNITVGGAGKTPVSIMTAGMLKKAGRKIAVVSRGYGRKSDEPVQTVSDGKTILTGFPDGADEALLCAQELAGVPVICSPQRLDGIRTAKEKFSMETVVLDDAFSHLAAARDLNLLLIDAVNPFGNGWLIPAGMLREPLGAIGRADAVLITRANLAGSERTESVKQTVWEISKNMPVFEVDIKPEKIITPEGEEKDAGEYLAGKKVTLVSGIASPHQFETLVGRLGAEVEKHFAFADHHPFTEADIAKILGTLSPDSFFLTTQKDYVRIPADKKKLFCQLAVTASVRELDGFRKLISIAGGAETA